MNPFQQYQKVDVSTADPVRIIVLLYEGAIKNLNIVIRNWGVNDEKASGKLHRTHEIINYLRTALDHDLGGEVATNLDRLYNFMRDELNEANLHKDAERIRGVIELLQTLLDGWRGIQTAQNSEEDEHAAPPAESVNLSIAG